MLKEITISGFSYVRNGFEYGVPFLEAIQSILPVCDEFIVAVGDSHDGTREAIVALNSPKIKIIDTVWDMSVRKGGKVFAQQSNIGLDYISGDWAFHIQADEVVHESNLAQIVDYIQKYQNDEEVDGLLFPFIHFWGDYNHICTSRRLHKYEIRVFRNNKNKYVRSYRDSQGFRIYKNNDSYEQGLEKGKKLKVVKTSIPIYHYKSVRSPSRMKYKIQHFTSYYNGGEIVHIDNPTDLIQRVDRLELFNGEHPKVMQSRIENQDWEFVYDPSKAVWRRKDKIMEPIEKFIGHRFGEYKNYIVLRNRQ
jgi:glycosyltransferase involved in cell wall biosynthesis